MCNTTYNNHSHEEYNIDYIGSEQILEISKEDVPCDASNITYIISDECDCNKNKPKKVSCRSLACQQSEKECECNKNNTVRKTTMVDVLENDLLRLQDKVEDGCSSLNKSVEDIMNNMNVIYNAVKDEETRAKLQEAFLHYGLDKTVTRAWYNPNDNRIHFYHQNPENCLTADVTGECDCNCCNACGCECKCNNDDCLSDVPYTMDDDCNIVRMNRNEVELPFTIDCSNFLSVRDNNPTLYFGDTYDVATIGDTTIHVTMPDNPTLVTAYNPILDWGKQSNVAKINDTFIKVRMPEKPEVNDDYVVSGTINSDNQLILTRKDGGTVPPIAIPIPPQTRHITNITQDGNKVTFEWSDGSEPTVINMGGDCLWKEVGDHIIPVDENKKVYGGGFYDTTVS